MTENNVFDAIESRAFAARLTMQELCQRAEIHQSVWSRAKARGSIRVKVLRRIEEQLDMIEREAAA